jgi:manganese-dependent inorganic pyrophosphatase
MKSVLKKTPGKAREEKPEIFIIGHKNPDTDSICSGIAYAWLKNKLEPGCRFIPMRIGKISHETQFVLEYFGVESPEYLDNVYTQLKDIDFRKIEGISKDFTLKKAWEVMKDSNIVSLPVICDDKLEGIITVKDIVNVFMDVDDAQILAKSQTSYQNILEAIDGTLLVDNGKGRIDGGKILVAAANPDVLGSFIDAGDTVITANRYESQLCAIELRAGCIITTTGAEVAERIQRFAKEYNCAIITTPYDTYTTAKMINQSIPVSYVMKEKGIITFCTDDLLETTKNTMLKYRYRDFPVIDRHGNYAGMISRRFLLNANKKKVILVDHNEITQTVEGIEEAEILEIIDHHRIGSIQTLNPVYFRNQPVGCTATIINQLYKENGIQPEKQIAGLLCSAIISDTLLFTSPTSTEADKEAAMSLSGIAGIDIEEFSREMFKTGSANKNIPPEEILNQDYKEFSLNDIDFGIGQITSMFEDELAEIKEKLKPYLQVFCEEKKVDMVYIMLTNIAANNSEIICAGVRAEELLHEAFVAHEHEYRKSEDGSVLLAGVVSRKKQMAPAILAAIQG